MPVDKRMFYHGLTLVAQVIGGASAPMAVAYWYSRMVLVPFGRRYAARHPMEN